MRFDETVVKVDDHNAAYDSTTGEMKIGPTCKVFHNASWYIGVSLHKWTHSEGPTKGAYIAVLPLHCIDEASPEDSQKLDDLKARFETIPDMFTQTEQGVIPMRVIVYKFSVNVWRPVVFKKTKWAFDSTPKPNKDEPSFVQRLLIE